MKIDYKFWYILRLDDVHISEVAVRFYEGEVTTQNERGVDGGVVAVTRYRRMKQLKKINQPYFRDRETIKDASGNDILLFTKKDFGVISTDDELRLYLNGQLAKDKTRMPIDEQK